MRYLLLCVALAGCVSNTGAVPLGNGEYMVTVETDVLTGGVAGAQRRAVEAATAQCGARTVVPGDVAVTPQRPATSAAFTMRFHCRA